MLEDSRTPNLQLSDWLSPVSNQKHHHLKDPMNNAKKEAKDKKSRLNLAESLNEVAAKLPGAKLRVQDAEALVPELQKARDEQSAKYDQLVQGIDCLKLPAAARLERLSEAEEALVRREAATQELNNALAEQGTARAELQKLTELAEERRRAFARSLPVCAPPAS